MNTSGKVIEVINQKTNKVKTCKVSESEIQHFKGCIRVMENLERDMENEMYDEIEVLGEMHNKDTIRTELINPCLDILGSIYFGKLDSLTYHRFKRIIKVFW